MTLQEALKYAAGEQEAFEKRIDENPFDSDNHLIYADWLDDQGHSQEAAFRRAMGEWVRRGPDDAEGAERWNPTVPKSFGVAPPEGTDRTHFIKTFHMPEWAKNLQVYRPTTLYDRLPTTENPHIGYRGNSYYTWWRDYRSMEEGLRRAFNRHTQEQQ